MACGALGSNSSCLLPICSDKLLSGGGAWPGEDPLGRVGPWVPWNERQILRLASTDLQRVVLATGFARRGEWTPVST